MFKVSRKSEYALMAVQHLARHPGTGVVSVADLAAQAEIPHDVLAKVLQSMKRVGILRATKGATGGYALARQPAEIRFLEVVQPFEEQLAVVSCQTADGDCDRSDTCTLRDPMTVLNAFVIRQFESLTMDMFVAPHSWLHSGSRGTAATAATSMARRSLEHAGAGPSV